MARRLLFISVTVVLALAIVELGTRLLLLGFGPAAPAASENDAASDDDDQPPERGRQLDRVREHQALHPFLGFVSDRDRLPGLQPEQRTAEAAEYGFPFGGEQIFYEASPQRVVVALLGGSVANILATSGPTLAHELAEIPRFAGKEVVIVNLALAGYKQPQQLMTLVYFLSLGAHFDVVLNVDGFNEVTLASIEHSKQGVFPFYPRAWRTRVGELAPQERLALGRVSYLEAERDLRRERLASSPWRLSAIWRAPELAALRRLDSEIYEAAAQLRRSKRRSSYQATGPRFEVGSETELTEALAQHWMQASLLLHDLCERRRIEYYHVLQPNQYLPGSKRLTEEEERLAFRADHPYRQPVLDAYPRLIELGEELRARGVAFVDLTRVFKPVARTIYVDTCCHFNLRGNIILARAIARFVRLEPDPFPQRADATPTTASTRP